MEIKVNTGNLLESGFWKNWLRPGLKALACVLTFAIGGTGIGCFIAGVTGEMGFNHPILSLLVAIVSFVAFGIMMKNWCPTHTRRQYY